MDCMTIYLGYGFYSYSIMKSFLQVGIFIFLTSSAYADNDNPNTINAVRIEPSLSTTDQFIIIGCVTGFTLAMIIALMIGCYIKYITRSDKQKIKSDKDYNSLDKIRSHDFANTIQAGDRKLAKSAQMYHYQLSKQNLIELEKAESDKQDKERTSDESESNEECTVYECAGLGNMRNMEIRNPLFDDGSSTIVNSNFETTGGSVVSSAKPVQ